MNLSDNIENIRIKKRETKLNAYILKIDTVEGKYLSVELGSMNPFSGKFTVGDFAKVLMKLSVDIEKTLEADR